jgi:hypothetical protein
LPASGFFSVISGKSQMLIRSLKMPDAALRAIVRVLSEATPPLRRHFGDAV